MPNHMYNKLIIDAEESLKNQILKDIKRDDADIGSIDFNKIIPMPKELYKGDLGKEERELYGGNNWYDWSVKHWGTKWNSYNQGCPPDTKDNSLVFNTAWSPVYPLIKKLSEIYPEATFTYEHADEEVGAIVGRNVYKNGEITEQYLPENFSKEAYELMSEIEEISLEDIGYMYDEEKGNYFFNEYEESEDMEL